ncbi:MAG: hypothetical protein FJ290_00865 [Planctomycetes bacterium]|nr:hypothetical protein [Planctomycetota bacterium]
MKRRGGAPATPAPEPGVAAPPAAPPDRKRAEGLARLVTALEAVEEQSARGMVAKAAAGAGLTKAELDSIPRLRERLRERLAREDAEDEESDAAAPTATAEAPGSGVVDRMGEVAARFGRSLRQVQNWKRDGMPVRSGGGYDLAEIAAWLRERHPGAVGGRGLREEREYWEARYRKLKCELTELQVRIERGELLDREVELARKAEVLREFRARLLAVPSALCNRLVGLSALEIKGALKSRIHDALSELARL